ncbi:MAG: hypothetical protein K0Q78_799 [Cellvibrio sp.]|nr:hypothetical protein [Cellvibrio sp.]
MKTQEKTMQNNRRQLLKMIAGGSASAPFVSAGLLAAGAGFANTASAATSVKNVIFVFIPGGAPGGASTTITPSAGLQLKACSAPLEPVKQECVFFANTNMQGHGCVVRQYFDFCDKQLDENPGYYRSVTRV